MQSLLAQQQAKGLFGRKPYGVPGGAPGQTDGPLQANGGGGDIVPNTRPNGLFGSSSIPSRVPIAALLGDGGQPPALPDSSNLPNGWIAQQARERGGLSGPYSTPPFAPDRSPPLNPDALPQIGQRPLGGSMRQPFDYEAELKKLLPPEHHQSTLQKIAMYAAPILMSLGGNQAGANAFTSNVMARRQREEQRRYEIGKTLVDWKHSDWARQNGADLGAAAPFTIGKDRLAYNPATGQVTSLYHGPADWESYAETLGLEPGSKQYMDAAKDYVLRSNGPTAYANDIGLDDHRTGNRLKLEGVRQSNRTALEGVRQGNRITTRQTPTYHDTHPTPRGGKTGGGRPRATNAQGQTVEYDGKAWVPVH